MFLTSDAIFSTLRTIAALAPGTEVIFQYSVPKELVDKDDRWMLAVMMADAATRGEPLQSFFQPAELAEEMRKLAFAEVSDLGPDEARAHYFAGRTDGFRPLASQHLMQARVGSRSN